MADDNDQQYASKRDRQKARRAARLEREAQAAAAASRNRTVTYGIVVVLVVALIAGLIYLQIRQGQQESALADEVAGRLDELGCTEDERQADLGGGHIAGDGASLAAEGPDVIYPDHPPSSGRHIGQVVASGVYDEVVDPRFTTHNQEHGYVIVHYDADSPEDEVEQMKDDVAGFLDGDYPKMVVAEYYRDLPDDANFALTAWFQRQLCEQWDPDVLQVFLNNHYDTDGEGPEKGIPSHNPGAQGVVDPSEEEGDTLLPPLDETLGGEATDVEDAEEASPEIDPSPQDGPAEDEPADEAPAEGDPADEPTEE